MPRWLYCTSPATDRETGVVLGLYCHDWINERAVESNEHSETIFVSCPDHDGLPNSEGRDHVGLQYSPLLPR